MIPLNPDQFLVKILEHQQSENRNIKTVTEPYKSCAFLEEFISRHPAKFIG